MKARRRNAAEWASLLQRYSQSGQSMADFAGAEGLDARYFARKMRRLAGSAKPSARSARSAFVRATPPITTAALMIQIADVRIHSNGPVEPDWIAAVARALRA
jgi:hypothetical protein